MVYLDDAQHEGLRRLAFERRCTMAALIREALEAYWGERLKALTLPGGAPEVVIREPSHRWHSSCENEQKGSLDEHEGERMT